MQQKNYREFQVPSPTNLGSTSTATTTTTHRAPHEDPPQGPHPQPLHPWQVHQPHPKHRCFTPSFLFTAYHNLSAPRSQMHRFTPVHSHSPTSSPSSPYPESFARTGSTWKHCVTLNPLVLPNLKLKVLIKAIVYLKNTVEIRTWWFSVRFKPHKFEHAQVEKLCSFIDIKVNDGALVGLITRLFECTALVIELGGDCLGRGFPQECGLCSVLMNVYFDGFDKQIQEMRLRENRELDPKTVGGSSLGDDVFYKPGYAVRTVKGYAVRTTVQGPFH